MSYRMKHPEHGYHNCYTPEDVEIHKKLGWELTEDKKEIEHQVEISNEPKKRGRKPKK